MEPQLASLIESGTIKFTFKDRVLGSQSSLLGAEATHCAADQGKFWAYHKRLLANQKQWTNADLKQYAGDLGLDTAKFGQCLDSGTYTEQVNKSTQEAQSLGVNQTPTFLLNGKVIDWRGDLSEVAKQVKKAVGK